MTEATAWPRKTVELQNRLLDSTVWNDVSLRDDDVVIATYGKTGTTWMQQIVGQLLFNGNPDLDLDSLSPWVEFRMPTKAETLAAVEAQTHRRFLKTHLLLDALVFSPRVKYIYIGRDGRDVVWSFFNHHSAFDQPFYERLNSLPGGVGPPFEPPSSDIGHYWHDWLNRNGYPLWSFWDNVNSWWNARHLPNVLLVHFTDLKRDMPGEIRRIAAFLEIPIDQARWDAILEYCSFDWMKAQAIKSDPVWGNAFFHRGVNGRWSDTLSSDEVAEYESRAVRELGPECARWLATGDRR